MTFAKSHLLIDVTFSTPTLDTTRIRREATPVASLKMFLSFAWDKNGCMFDAKLVPQDVEMA